MQDFNKDWHCHCIFHAFPCYQYDIDLSLQLLVLQCMTVQASVDAAKEEGGDRDESKTVLNLSPVS